MGFPRYNVLLIENVDRLSTNIEGDDQDEFETVFLLNKILQTFLEAESILKFMITFSHIEVLRQFRVSSYFQNFHLKSLVLPKFKRSEQTVAKQVAVDKSRALEFILKSMTVSER